MNNREQLKAERKRALGHNQNVKAGVKERSAIPQGFIRQLKLGLKLWEIEQESPHLRKARSF